MFSMNNIKNSRIGSGSPLKKKESIKTPEYQKHDYYHAMMSDVDAPLPQDCQSRYERWLYDNRGSN